MRVALVHDWLTGMRGGEKVLEVFCELYPDADLFTLLHVPGSVSQVIEKRRITVSFIQKLPMAAGRYRSYLPMFPLAVESFDLKRYDLVISSSHCVAKGVIQSPSALHISYVHTPMRYVWDRYDDYFGAGRAGLHTRAAARLFSHYLRMWDAASSSRVDHFVANSRYVANRIEKYYRRKAAVIHPPVDCSRFAISKRQGDYYLLFSAFAPYKRLDLAIEAFRKLQRRLVVIGSGQDEKRLKAMAGPNIEFLGRQPDDAIARYYSEAKALIFPGEEDFGIVPLEAMASGRPVIAYGKGGALETVVPPGAQEPPTGLFFPEQTADSLIECIRLFEENETAFNPEEVRAHALRFDRPVFKQTIKERFARLCQEKAGMDLC